MLRGPANESIKFYLLSNNRLLIWATQAFGFSIGSKLLALLVAGICGVSLLAVRRQGNLMAGFSICAILSLYWSYSRHYDFLILAIPLVELLRLWRTEQSRLAAVAFLLLGILLWCPIRIEMSRWPSIQLMYAAACLLALATIVHEHWTAVTRTRPQIVLSGSASNRRQQQMNACLRSHLFQFLQKDTVAHGYDLTPN